MHGLKMHRINSLSAALMTTTTIFLGVSHSGFAQTSGALEEVIVTAERRAQSAKFARCPHLYYHFWR